MMNEDKLSTEEKKLLLAIARRTIEAYLGGEETPQEKVPEGSLTEPRGAFVTLHHKGRLRGCIGTFVATTLLHRTVQEMAISAATRDPRFPPVTAQELPSIDLEISALTPLREITDTEEIEVGTHGINISRGFFAGVLLPQVAVEQGWDRQTFLEHTCLKAGLPTDAWKQEGTRIEIFSAEVFGERELTSA